MPTVPTTSAPGAHHDIDEDLVDFLARHELGPCAECEEIHRQAVDHSLMTLRAIVAMADIALETVR